LAEFLTYIVRANRSDRNNHYPLPVSCILPLCRLFFAETTANNHPICHAEAHVFFLLFCAGSTKEAAQNRQH